MGEALVDLICPDPVADAADARRFEVHFGGALANVAVAAAQAGAPAALAGGCGEDAWGRLLRSRLEREGVRLDHHSLVPGCETPWAFVILDERREPSFRIQGAGIEEGIATLGGRASEIVDGAAAIVIGSNTLPDEGSRAITHELVEAAARADVPILFDPNLRPGRWADLDEARELCLEIARRATVLKCNRGEAAWLLGGDGGPRAADELCELGPRLTVLTDGSGPVVAGGVGEAVVEPPAVEVVSPLGAGDVFMGHLAAGLHEREWELHGVRPVLERAAGAAAQACERLGAFAA